MRNQISTEEIILINFLCKNMPNLFKYIVQYSKPYTKKSTKIPPSKKLTAKQIYNASMHSSTTVKKALKTAAGVQKAINTVDAKIHTLIEQRKTIENSLLKLLSTKS